MTCRAVLDLLSDHLDAALTPDEHARVELHLAECAPCQAYLDQLRTTVTAVSRLACEDVPADLQRELLAAFRTWHTDRDGAHNAL